MITLKGSYGDSSASANSQIALDRTQGVVGDKLTISNNAVRIGNGVSKVLVTAAVFYCGSSSAFDYGWFRINKNNTDTGYTAITYKGTSSYGTASIPLVLLDVEENDIISVFNLQPSTVRGTGSYLTVIAIG